MHCIVVLNLPFCWPWCCSYITYMMVIYFA